MNEEHMKKTMTTAEITEAPPEEDNDWRDLEQEVTSSEIDESPVETLLRDEDIDELQSRWSSIQIEFVDEPRLSVEQADALVTDVMERITQMFSEQRALLNGKWINDQDVSTEDLRVVLRHYRSFFNRLIAL